MKHGLYVLMIGLLCIGKLYGQLDSTNQQIEWTSDYRFRIEQDWDSRKSDGTYRSDRSRLRYRFRFGLNKKITNWSSFGGRLRTGNETDQQGPHLTLGGNNSEFGLVQIGLEKLFVKFKFRNWSGWLGKNTFPFEKNDELFWNDNTFPEGVNVNFEQDFSGNKIIGSIGLRGGHFIINSSGQGFGADRYFQALQLVYKGSNGRLKIFPGLYHFNKLGNVPDGKESFEMDYSIFHFGISEVLLKQPKIELCFDYYMNVENYETHDSIPSNLREAKKGIVSSVKVGTLEKKGNWQVSLYYANLAKYSIVDYFAQNDWARWDYSNFGANGSRLSNFEGVELRIGYASKEKYNLILRTYFVEELEKRGLFTETGKRIRLDLNIGF